MAKIYLRHCKMFIVSFIVYFLGAVFGSGGFAQPTVIFRNISGGFTQPVDVVNAGDGSNRLFIVQRGGLIRIFRNNAIVTTPFMDLSDSIITSGGEQGLLSLAFHPDYENNRTFFVYYTNEDGAITIARFRTRADNPDLADDTTGKILLTIPKSFTNHNGGKLIFGPDGYLYFGTGDGGSGGDPGNNAQNGNSLLGKLLRINVTNVEVPPYYTIPPDNPYISNPNVRDEIWAMGLRNPWRWSFDRSTHDMWIADVGQDKWEELNFRPAAANGGINYGWRCYEGTHTFNVSGCQPVSGYQLPIFEYPHDTTGGFSVTGGYVYRGAAFPQMQGYYLMTDWSTGHLWKVKSNGTGGWNITRQPKAQGNIVGFGEGENGELYAVQLNNGILHAVEAAPEAPLPIKLLNFQAQSGTGGIVITWQTTFEQNMKQFDIEFSEDNIDFALAGSVPAKNYLQGSNYRFSHTVFNIDRIYYRLKMVDADGSAEYSRVITLDLSGAAKNYIFPTAATNGTVSLYLNESYENVEIVDMMGRMLKKQQISGRTGRIDIPLPASATGSLIVRLNHTDQTKNISQKIFVR